MSVAQTILDMMGSSIVTTMAAYCSVVGVVGYMWTGYDRGKKLELYEKHVNKKLDVYEKYTKMQCPGASNRNKQLMLRNNIDDICKWKQEHKFKINDQNKLLPGDIVNYLKVYRYAQIEIRYLKYNMMHLDSPIALPQQVAYTGVIKKIQMSEDLEQSRLYDLIEDLDYSDNRYSDLYDNRRLYDKFDHDYNSGSYKTAFNEINIDSHSLVHEVTLPKDDCYISIIDEHNYHSYRYKKLREMEYDIICSNVSKYYQSEDFVDQLYRIYLKPKEKLENFAFTPMNIKELEMHLVS